MKIALFFMNPIEFAGGSEKSFSELAAALRDDGHAVTITGSSSLYRLARSAITAIVTLLSGQNLPSRQSFYVERDLKDISVQRAGLAELMPGTNAHSRFISTLRDVDVIYCKNEWFDVLSLRYFLPSSLMGKVVIGVHTSIVIDEEAARTPWGRLRSFLYEGRFYRRQLEMCGAVHTLNAQDTAAIAAQYGMRIASKTVSIPLPLVMRQRNQRWVQRNPGSLPLRLLFAQRLTRQKGLDYFAGLVRGLSASPQFARLTFTIAGRGDSTYEELAAELSQTYSNVSYLGFVANMSDLYDQHDIVVIPSRWETFSHVAVEAQAAGLPVIAFDIPGPNGIVDHSSSGWLVPLGDIDALCALVEEIVTRYGTDPGFLQAMGQRGQQSVMDRFGRDSVLRRQVALFSNVAHFGRPNTPATESGLR